MTRNRNKCPEWHGWPCIPMYNEPRCIKCAQLAVSKEEPKEEGEGLKALTCSKRKVIPTSFVQECNLAITEKAEHFFLIKDLDGLLDEELYSLRRKAYEIERQAMWLKNHITREIRQRREDI